MVSPEAAERCTPEGETARDENCNGLVDEIAACAPDNLDNDGSVSCSVDPGPGCDCNDCNPGIEPGAVEQCGDGIDQDCDGSDTPCVAGDGDGDGFASASVGGTDCDDDDATIHPDAPERCDDRVDQDCDGSDSPCTDDGDGDGWIEEGDCDSDPELSPEAVEECNGVDDDCDSRIDEMPPGRGCVQSSPGAMCGEDRCRVDFDGSLAHCGGCRRACNTGATLVADECVRGECNCSGDPAPGACRDGETCCEDGCHDLSTDLASCGRCGRTCGEGANRCVDGDCRCGEGATCLPGRTCCDGVGCVDLEADPESCGGCGIECGTGETCVRGQCTCGNSSAGRGEGAVCSRARVCCRGPRCRTPTSR